MDSFIKKMICMVITSIVIITSMVGCNIEEGKPKEGYQVALLVPILGDQSFYDLAASGVRMAKEQLEDVDVKIIEIGTDESKWESYFLDAAEGRYDLIISGTWQQTPYLDKIAKQYPDKKFINFDIDKGSGIDNVYSMFYSTNEIGYLAGVAAAGVTMSDMKNANEEATIGFIGGMDIPGINDFLVGYIEGALSVNENIKVLTSYTNDFDDIAKAKEISINQYKNGADIIFTAAGNAGNGTIEAAKELDKYVIGVDSDQAKLYVDTDIKKANAILTSAIKTIDLAILNAIEDAKNGTLDFGKHVKYDYASGGVGLAKNEIYENQVNDSVKKIIEEAEYKLKDAEVTVSTAFEMDVKQINDMKESVK